MSGMDHLLRDTWSTLPMETWELDALVELLERTDPQTPAQEVIRQRVLDAQCRRDQVEVLRQERACAGAVDNIVTWPQSFTELDDHLRAMHGTLVYNMGDYEDEHVEQHQRAEIGQLGEHAEFWTPHTHPEALEGEQDDQSDDE